MNERATDATPQELATSDFDVLEHDVDEAIAACDGDPRAAVRALLVANNYLAAEVDRLSASISRGYTRGRNRECG
jgi:hypothetical protein